MLFSRPLTVTVAAVVASVLAAGVVSGCVCMGGCGVDPNSRYKVQPETMQLEVSGEDAAGHWSIVADADTATTTIGIVGTEHEIDMSAEVWDELVPQLIEVASTDSVLVEPGSCSGDWSDLAIGITDPSYSTWFVIEQCSAQPEPLLTEFLELLSPLTELVGLDELRRTER